MTYHRLFQSDRRYLLWLNGAVCSFNGVSLLSCRCHKSVSMFFILFMTFHEIIKSILRVKNYRFSEWGRPSMIFWTSSLSHFLKSFRDFLPPPPLRIFFKKNGRHFRTTPISSPLKFKRELKIKLNYVTLYEMSGKYLFTFIVISIFFWGFKVMR